MDTGSIENKIKAFLTCSVRFATDEEKKFYSDYKKIMSQWGYDIHYPEEDTNQVDKMGGGYHIIIQNGLVVRACKQNHVFWTNSEGSRTDVSQAIVEQKLRKIPILIINPKFVEGIVAKEREKEIPKSYSQSLLYASKQYDDELTRKYMDMAVTEFCKNSHLPKLTFEEGYNFVK